jgi:hypothetical protein
MRTSIIRTRDLVCQTPASKNLVVDSILEANQCRGNWELFFGGKIDTMEKKEGTLRSMVSPRSSNYPQGEAAFVGSLLQLLPQYLASGFAPLSQTNIDVCNHRQE